MIADKGFDWLDASVKRLGAMDTPKPYNDELARDHSLDGKDCADGERIVAVGNGLSGCDWW